MIGQRSHYILLQPGDFVRLQGRDDWGHGQVQSAIGNKITVNFDHAGKQMINSDHAVLIPIKRDDLPSSDQS